MTFKEYQIEELEKQLSKQEGYEVKILSIDKIDNIKHITITSYGTYLLMKKEGFIKEIL